MKQFIFKLKSAFDNQKGTLILQAESIEIAINYLYDKGWHLVDDNSTKHYVLERSHDTMQRNLNCYLNTDKVIVDTLINMDYDLHDIKNISPVQRVDAILREGIEVEDV